MVKGQFVQRCKLPEVLVLELVVQMLVLVIPGVVLLAVE